MSVGFLLQSNIKPMNFKRNLAVVIGINQYQNGINPLQTAVPDAQKLSKILDEVHGYTLIHPDDNTNAAILNTEATLEQLKILFLDILPNRVQPTVQDRLFIYFAGHGITRQVNDQGPQGFLVPQDADINNCDSLLPMGELYAALNQLECRHLFVVLDCCFAGMFRWAGTRKVVLVPDEIHWEHYHRFIKYPAWQVITSAAYNQEALDYLDNRVTNTSAKHSPFAEALFEGLLEKKADIVPDGVITAAELYLYLRDYVEKHSNEQQTPGFWPLSKHDRGEYIFQLVPEEDLKLKDAPKLEKDNNPYRGLESFDEKHTRFFFGREAVVDELVNHISKPARQFTVVDGASGSGKSSLVKAGLVSRLKEQYHSAWHVFTPIRPGTDPYHALAFAVLPTDTSSQDIKQASEAIQKSPETLILLIEAWSQLYPGKHLLLIIDQFEELITLAPKRRQNAAKIDWHNVTRGRRFEWQIPAQSLETRLQWQVFTESLAQAIERCPQLHLLITLRSDFSPRFKTSALGSIWADARFWVRPMRSNELREAVIGPANEMALYFEPANLVDTLVDEVAQTPGALPLISFTLSELYLNLHSAWNREGKEDRALAVDSDFYVQGGVVGLLAKRANEEYDQLPDDAHRRTMKQIILRMVEIEGSEAIKRRVSKKELLYVNAQENQRVETVLAKLDSARLIISGSEAEDVYVEPAHDYLVRGWDRLQDWIQEEQETLLLQRLLIPAANNWYQTKRDLWHGNSRLMLLKQIQKSRNNWLNQLEMLFIQSSLNRKRLNISSRLSFLGLVMMVGTFFWLTNDQLVAATQQNLSAASTSLKETAKKLEYISAKNAKYELQHSETLRNLDEVNERANQEALAKEAAIVQKEEEEKKAQAAAQLAQKNYATAQRNAINQLSETAKLFMSKRKHTEAMVFAISAAYMSGIEALWEEGAPPSTVPLNLLTAAESNRELNVFEVPMAAVPEDTVSESAALAEAVYTSAITSNGNIISGNHKGEIHFWQANSEATEPIHSLELSGEVSEIFVTDNDDTFVWLKETDSTTLKLLKEENESLSTKEIKQFEGEQRPVSVAIASSSQTIAIGSQVGKLTVLDNQGKEIWSDTEHGMDAINCVAISPNGKTVVVAGQENNDPKIQIWNEQTLRETVSVDDDPSINYSNTTAVTISPDGQNIVLVGDDTTGNSHISVWNLEGKRRNHQLMRTEGKTEQLSVTNKGNILATVADPKTAIFNRSDVYLWSIRGERLLNETVEGDVLDAVIAPNGETIVLSTLEDRTNKIHLWESDQAKTAAQYFLLSKVTDSEIVEAISAEITPPRTVVPESSSSESTKAEPEISQTDETLTDQGASETVSTEEDLAKAGIVIDEIVIAGTQSSLDTTSEKKEMTEEDAAGKALLEKESSTRAVDMNDFETNDIEVSGTESVTDESNTSIQLDAQTTVAESNNPDDIPLKIFPQGSSVDSNQTFIAVTPNSKTVAIGENYVSNGTKIHQLRVKNTDLSSSLLGREFIELEGDIHALSISKTGERVAVMLKAGKLNSYYVKILDVKTGRFLKNPLSLEGEQVLAQISPDGQTLFSATTTKEKKTKYSSKVQSWDLAVLAQKQGLSSDAKAQSQKTQEVAGEISALAISENGTRLIIAHNQGFNSTRTGYKFGGHGKLTVWDISPEGVGKEDLDKKAIVETEGYIGAIAIASTAQEVALVTHHAERQMREPNRDKVEEIGVRNIISKIETWTWEGQPTSKTLSLGTGKFIQFVGLMPDGENIVIAGHEVTSLKYRSGEFSVLVPTIKIFNKQSQQLSDDLAWSTAIGADKTEDIPEGLAKEPINKERLTSLVVTANGEYIFSSVRQPKQTGVIRWDLRLDKLLQASCNQIWHHPILHKPKEVMPESEKIAIQTRDICKPIAER